jgi:hypothetical protein
MASKSKLKKSKKYRRHYWWGKGSDITAGTDVPLETVGFLI